MSYLSDTYSVEQFLDDKEKSARKLAISAINNHNLFCLDFYKIAGKQVFSDLEQAKSEEKTIIMFNNMVNWWKQDHLEIIRKCGINYSISKPWKGLSVRTIKIYTRILKELLDDCYGITLNDRRFRKKVKIPKMPEFDRAPFTKEDLRLLCQYAEPNKRMLYKTLKDSGMRIGEAVSIRKKDVDFTKDPVEIYISEKISKTNRARTTYLTRETSPELKNFVIRLDDDSLVFGSNNDPDRSVKAEEQAFVRIRKEIGKDYPHFLERYESSNYHKKNLHALRAYTATQCAEAVNEDFGHAIIGHKKYLGQYIRNQNKMPELYKRSENHLMIYQTIELVDTSTELHEMKKEMLELKRLFKMKIKTEKEIEELKNTIT